MANEFVARKGLIVSGSTNISGSVTASYFKGDGSQLTNLPSTNISSVVINNSSFVGDGTTNTFNLGASYTPNSLMVSVDGLFYSPTADFTVSGNNIIFTSAPPSASDITIRAMTNVVSGAVGTYSGSFTGVFTGTGSWATNAISASYLDPSGLPSGTVSSSAQITYTQLQNIPVDIVSSSVQVKELLPTNTVSSSAQVTAFLPNGTVSSSTQINTGSFTGSFVGDGSNLTGIATVLAFSGSTSGTDTLNLKTEALIFSGSNGLTATVTNNTVTFELPSGTVSSSAQYPGWVTASSQVVLTQTDGYTSFSSSLATVDEVQNIEIASLVNNTGSYATTASNTFTGIQTITNTTNATNYLDGALVVAGGVGITKDVYISGGLNITGLLTVASMSTQYVTSSQYNVGVSRITLNDDDLVRFAGLSIFDSGSSSPTTASIFWDSLQHRFIYENLSGSAYNSAVIIAGPKNTGSLGSEQELTFGRITYASGGDHIDNSPAQVIGTSVHFDGNVVATGSITASAFNGSIIGTSSWATNAITASNAELFDGRDSVTFATTGSNTFVGTQTLSGSINFQSGSSISPNSQDLEIKPGVGGELLLFNSDSSHYLSIDATGITITDLNVLNGITGSLQGTSSWAASASNAITASYALNAGAGAGFPFSGSAVITGSLLVSGSGITGSLLGTSSWATNAATASYALNAGAGAGFPFSGDAVITGSLYVSGSTISGSFVGDGSGLTGINISTAVISDVYSFVGNGSTQLYVLSQSYFPTNVQVSVDGLVLTRDVDYYYTTGSITFVLAPPSSSNILVSALLNAQDQLTGSFTGSFIGDGHGLTNLPLAINIDTYKFVADGINIDYPLNYEYGPNSLFINVAGITYSHPEDYIISGSSIVFTEVPASSSNIIIRAFQSQSFIGSSSYAATSSLATTASFANTASYALNAGAGAGFPYSGSAVITGSLLVVGTGSVGGITGSFSGSGAGLYDLRSSLALDTYNFIGDGATVDYILSQSYTPNSLFVSVEGINYTYIEDFTLSSNTLTFVVAPPSQSNVSIRALLSVSSGSYINYTGSFIGDGYGLDNLRGAIAIESNKFIGDGVTTQYTLSSSYSPQSMLVTVGGLRYIDANDYSLTGSTLNFVQAPASQSIIVAQAYLIVSSGSVGTFSGSFLGNATTATSASYATTASFASNVLKTKAGSIVSASFVGTPLSASVTFSTAFNNTNYSVAVTGEDARIFTVESKTASGFVVNTNSNTALTGTTYWTCTAYGEN